MAEIFSRFIPVFLIMAVGVIARRKGILQESVVEGFKRIIINIALPSILFLSFLTMELQFSYIWLFISLFVFCGILFIIGFGLQKIGLCRMPLSPFFFTGFEFGMVGVALFTSIFGTDQLYHILLLGLGHEFFIWFVYAPLLEAQNHGKIQIGKILSSFISSPIIIAIFSALFLNITGLYQQGSSIRVIEGLHQTLTMLSQLTTPLILLAIGFQLHFEHLEFKKTLRMILYRLIIVGGLGYLLYLFVDAVVMPVPTMMVYAFITFMLLPPPFIIPVFLGKELKKEAAFYNNALVLYTVVTLILFMGAMLIMNVQ
ncbi:MAG: hypothetical protein K9K78_03360 [Spirochaetales bacterium]|nr:hypothetical protein [Spirochaetales bacterium]